MKLDIHDNSQPNVPHYNFNETWIHSLLTKCDNIYGNYKYHTQEFVNTLIIRER